MGEWWTYSLSDFRMFAPSTYWRLVEAYNLALWPRPLAAVLVGVAAWLAVACRLPRAERFVLVALGGAWCWVAWAFYWQRLRDIHLAAPALAAMAVAQGVLLLAAAAISWRAPARDDAPALRPAGLALSFAAILLYPWAGLALGRPLAQAELAGWMPDPTALASLGFALALRSMAPWQRVALALLPAIFLLAGALHHATMAQ
jgi:hypothetical protein